jgi:hypothetical protein
MDNTEQKWIEDTLESWHGVQRPGVPAGLLEKALERAQWGKARVVKMPVAHTWRAAACALVLVVANLFLCFDFTHVGKKQPNDKEMFVREYFSGSDGPQI